MTKTFLDEMKDNLQNIQQSAWYAAERVIRTETNLMANRGEMLSYQEAGIEEYQFLATLDDRTCGECGDLDGRTFPVSEAKEGENYPPLHPFDRCTTIAVVRVNGEPVKMMERRARSRARDQKTGKLYKVPGDMTSRSGMRGCKEVKKMV